MKRCAYCGREAETLGGGVSRGEAAIDLCHLDEADGHILIHNRTGLSCYEIVTLSPELMDLLLDEVSDERLP